MEQSLHDLVGNDPAARIAAVSHGGSTRAYVARILGIDFTDRHRLALLSNSAMARVVYGDEGPSVASWNLTPHLDPA